MKPADSGVRLPFCIIHVIIDSTPTFLRYLVRIPRQVLIGLVRFYQLTISPLLGAGSCRFTPTCSNYAVEALSRYGAVRGTILAVWRVLRCNPWNRGPTFDPPRWFSETNERMEEDL